MCLALTYLVVRFGYIAASAALAAAVVFLLDIDDATSGASLEDRLFAIVIGGGLAVMAHVALPDHALTRLHQRAGELLKTEIDYAATVVKAFVHELDHPADALSAAWQRAFRSRAAFEAASGATRVDTARTAQVASVVSDRAERGDQRMHGVGAQPADAPACRVDP